MIDTFSIFYYGYTVNSNNLNLPFNEGAGEINASLTISSNSLTEFVVNMQNALNAASVTRTFTVSVDRNTRKITISADGTFDLLTGTGTTLGTSVFPVAGFSTGTDLTGLTSYTGDLVSGSAYEPQFKLQSFVDKEDFQEFNDASVNESASGEIETIRYGTVQFYEFDIKFITNLVMDGKVIKNNPTGLQDARLFLRDITTRSRFEFMPDIDDRSTFDRVILEQIPGNRTATGYKLKELFDQNLRDIYETGIIRLRVVT